MKRGFTLIEILVSVALFSVVMVVALGALISLSSAVRRAQAINTTINNLAGAFDSMTRNIRTGTNYYCGSGGTGSNTNDCTTPSPVFTFRAVDGKTVTYCMAEVNSDGSYSACGTTSTCAAGKSCLILRCIASGSCTPTEPMTTAELNVRYLGFRVYGAGLGSADNTQPRVTLFVSGLVSITGTASSSLNLQTTVTQRIYDL